MINPSLEPYLGRDSYMRSIACWKTHLNPYLGPDPYLGRDEKKIVIGYILGFENATVQTTITKKLK